MNQVSVLASAALLALAATAPAQAAVTSFQTLLSAAGEPVPTSTATGAAVVSFDDIANSVTVLVSFAGLSANASAAHIHCCTATPGTGSSSVLLGFTGFPAASTGSYINVFSLSESSFDTLLAGAVAGKAYVNIHTPGLYAGGEIRGFLPAAPVPEPKTYAMLLAGIGMLGWMAKRRQRG